MLESLNINEISLPALITNKQGLILKFNQIALKLFNLHNCKSTYFNEFIEITGNQVINDLLVLKGVVKVKSHLSYYNIIQNLIYNKAKEPQIEYVVLLFIPENKFFAPLEKQINTGEHNTTLFTSKIYQDIIDSLDLGVIVLDGVSNKVEIVNKRADSIINQPNILADNDNSKSMEKLLKLPQYQRQIMSKLNINNTLSKDIKQIRLNCINLEKDKKLITLEDISEKFELEKNVNFSQRLQTIGQIASSVAHDFNNLLTAIMSFTYFLKERYSDDDPSNLELEQIQQNANRAKVMIRQLLTFSRSKTLDPQSININSEISSLMNTILRLIGENIQTEFIRGKNVGETLMDPVQFQQIIINLVVNARDAMNKGGKLILKSDLMYITSPLEGVISTIPSGRYIVISITDQGEGIATHNLRKIFQIHFSTKGDKGNGLGLATVMKILQENGGFVDVKSIEGVGTTFSIFLHSELTENEHKNTADITSKVQPNIDLTGSGNILLVEDEASVRMVCKKLLNSKGYYVLEAANAEDAFSLLQKSGNQVDLIISDVMMPGMSGAELVAKVRLEYPNIGVILMSGYAEDILTDKDYALDHIDFLAKPFSPDVLATKVKKMMIQKGDV